MGSECLFNLELVLELIKVKELLVEDIVIIEGEGHNEKHDEGL